MRKVIFIIGVIITIASLLSIFPYFSDFSTLSKYDKGYITGKIIIAMIGIALIVYGKKKPVHNEV